MKCPTFYINAFFIGIYIAIIGLTINDYEYEYNNMQIILPSTYTQYLARFGLGVEYFCPFWSNVKGQSKKSQYNYSNLAFNALLTLPFSLFCFYLIFSNWNSIIDSIIPNNFRYYDNIDENENKSDNKTTNNIILTRIVNILAILDFIIVSFVLLHNEDFKVRYYSILPHSSALILALTHFESRPSNNTLNNIINITRNYLPRGRFWLDTRENPIYPEVHCDYETFCSYHKESTICKNNQSNQTNINKEENIKEEEIPNIIILMVESFNPSTYLINEDFLEDHVRNPYSLKTNIPFYNKSIMPFLYNFARNEGITFSGMQTLGLPSHSGLHSLLTNEPPSQSYMNLINGWQNHVDDFASYFHQQGYKNIILNANKFNFDGKQYWIYKKSKYEEAETRMKCLRSYGETLNDSLQLELVDSSIFKDMRENCSEEDIEKYLLAHEDIYDFPRFFDYAASYYPTKKQAKMIGLDPETINEHPLSIISPDRIVSKQVEAHWKQQKNIMKNKKEHHPILTLVSSVEGHRPYISHDMPQFYKNNKATKKYGKTNRESQRIENFIKVYRYTDEYYLKEIIEWLKENDPNTIVLITGDHGTRNIPLKEKNGEVIKGIKFDPKCVYESTGSDSFFLVSGVISYLGKNERIRRAFGLDQLKGQTIKFTVDHSDMIYTTIDIIQRLRGKKTLPSNRKSRNIIDMSLELLKEDDEIYSNKIDKSGWKSISMVSHMIEYHHGMKMVRFHSGDPEGAHIYEKCVYPTGLLQDEFDEKHDQRTFVIPREEKNKTLKKKELELVKEAIEYLSAENYLGIKNRLFNYELRNEECIKHQNCTLPNKLPDLTFNDHEFLHFIWKLFVYGEILIFIPTLISALLKIYFLQNMNNIKKELEPLILSSSIDFE